MVSSFVSFLVLAFQASHYSIQFLCGMFQKVLYAYVLGTPKSGCVVMHEQDNILSVAATVIHSNTRPHVQMLSQFLFHMVFVTQTRVSVYDTATSSLLT